MTNQIAVLGLDALDIALVERWGCENLQLDAIAPLETEAWSTEYPHTREVWPSIATGKTPAEHGLSLDDTSETEWSNPLIDAASRMSSYLLPRSVREVIGESLHHQTKRELPQTETAHLFDDVYMWPGLTPATHLTDSWAIYDRVREEKITEAELRNELRTLFLDEVGWLAQASGSVVGVHSHILDVAGHLFARREDRLREYYESVDALVGWLRYEVDELVVISDHGMQVSWFDEDTEPGQHSFRAIVAATCEIEGLPDSIYDVKEWLSSNASSQSESRAASMDVTTDQLRSLGYIE